MKTSFFPILTTAILSFTAAAAPAAVVFNFNYIDAPGVGFNDASQGAARRNALAEAGNIVGSLFGSYNATINLDVNGSNTEAGTLAAAAANNNTGDTPGTGFNIRGDVMLKILNGDAADPAPLLADGTVTWNFAGQTWEYGSDFQPGEYDFISTGAHELLHAVGFDAGITQQGRDGFDTAPGTPGLWSPYARWVAGASGSIINSTDYKLDLARWNSASLAGGAGMGLRFNGPETLAANGGNPIFLFSPNSWQLGSSGGSHLDDAFYMGTYLMEAATNPGLGIRSVSAVEQAMLRDIGYALVPEPGVTVLLVGALGLFGVRRRR